MRAKVANRAKGHVFEDRFLKLDGLQLAIAYRQALKDEEAEHKLIRSIHENWVERFNSTFKALFLFTNPQMYGTWEQMKELDILRDEVKVEEFPELWDELMQFIPQEVIVDDSDDDPYAHIPKADPELEQMLTGFVPYKRREE